MRKPGGIIAVFACLLLIGIAGAVNTDYYSKEHGPMSRGNRYSLWEYSVFENAQGEGRNLAVDLIAGNPFDIKWSRTPGGIDDDGLTGFVNTPDKGYLAVGTTNTPTIPRYHGSDDVWVVKFNAKGKPQWQKCYGGGNNDWGGDIVKTKDGNYVFVAGTDSNNTGDVKVSHGSTDIWVVKIDPLGKILWSRLFGGSSAEATFYSPAIFEDKRGNLVIATGTNSNDGNVTGNHGSTDIWLLKLNKKGKLAWSQCYGGSWDDDFSEYPVRQLVNGNYLGIGSTESNDQQVSGNHGYSDAWLIEVNSTTGALESGQCFGGSNYDFGKFAIQTREGGFLISAHSYSYDQQVPGNYGGSDAWVAELYPDKTINWSKNFGGTNIDVLFWAHQLGSGDYLLSGRTYSTDGIIQGNHGVEGVPDGWVFTLNRTGSITWQRCFGGSGDDGLTMTMPRSATEYIGCGWTLSNDGDIFGTNHGGDDGWLVDFGVGKSWPPASITNLRNVTYKGTYINWTWKDPKNPDFTNVTVHLNGVFMGNVARGVRSYNATGLSPKTKYTLSTHTVDKFGNMNPAWVNKTAWTKN